jgi:metallo-beta-lactamase family protein
VKIYGEQVPVRARVAALEQFSDHADPPEMLEWLRTFQSKPSITYLVHGEPAAASSLRDILTKELKWKVEIAEWMERVNLR